jgi:hypothetical protein
VIPIACRPYIISDGNICDDDLTIQIVEIIKANNHLKEVDGIPVPEAKRQKYLQSLKFRIATWKAVRCNYPTNGWRSPQGFLRHRLESKRYQHLWYKVNWCY